VRAADHPTLKRLLDAEAGFDAAYGREGFANHRPMALHALARLGASDARLQALAATLERELRPAPPPAAWPAGDAWGSQLGRREAWPAYRDLFAQWLEADFAGDLLAQVLPRLFEGVAAGAFHGPIRVAHAVAAAHRGELADALAYWASTWMPLGAADGSGAAGGPAGQGSTGSQRRPGGQAAAPTEDAEAVLRRVQRVPAAGPSISAGLRAAAAHPAFEGWVAGLVITPATLPQLARLAAKAYAASGNFAVLHLVTGALAVHELLPHLDADDAAAGDAAVAAFWRGFVATVASAGIEAGEAPTPRPWPALVEAACASDDPHVIKLVDACRQWQALVPRGPWQAAATRAVAE
jgi:hypothetical protein